ncbi:MAG TPA: tetratricopeptide repeat protein [Chthoniobacterales bacterium]|nr:tetratricopeptide repeat protein [Chthoniobacterales bacterium]
MNPGSFFAELKRRNVYKVAVGYAVASWLLIQIATQVFPFFEIPNWAVRLVVLLLILGFPVALILSWAFEITPEGIKRESEVEANQPITHHTGRKIVGVTVVLAVIAAAMLAFQLLRSKGSAPRQSEAATAPAPQKSIAVLPFESLSEDKSNAYFAEGVQDEILTRLAKVADLKVISRTSTQRFKSAPSDLRDIAKQLGVMNILEGSVQKANDQVRVNVQLINAMTDAHLWADIYDRKLTDIFSVESDIAKTIADTLQAKLTGSEKVAMAKAPTENNEAYELYLKGRFFWNKRTGADLRKAIEYFNQAIAKDPKYARAYIGLADSYLLLPNYGAASPQDSIPQAKAAVKKALELDNTLGEAYATSAKIRAEHDFEFEQGINEFESAIQLSPNYATAHHWFGSGPLMALARSDRSIAEGKRAVELDPLSLINNADLGWVYFNARHYDEAIAQFRKTIEIDSHFYLTHYYLGEALLLKGQPTEAIAEYRTAVDLNDDPIALALLGQAHARAGQRDEAQKILARLTQEAKSRYVSGYSFALVLTGLGDKEGAIVALERAYRNGEGNDIYVIKVDPLLDDLRGQPRFEALVQKITGGK